MFRSNRVEFIAIPIMVVLLGVLFVVYAVASIGVWAWILTGVVILAAIVLVARRAMRRNAHPPAADAPRPPEHRPEGAYRIVVVVDASTSPAAVRDGISVRAGGQPCDVLVVAPAAGSHLDRLTGDEAGYATASRELDETLAALGSVDGVTAHGTVGSHDPIQALDESLREFPADEIVVAVDGVVDLARSRYGIAVTRLDVSSASRV